jgi:hypothetical protein
MAMLASKPEVEAMQPYFTEEVVEMKLESKREIKIIQLCLLKNSSNSTLLLLLRVGIELRRKLYCIDREIDYNNPGCIYL